MREYSELDEDDENRNISEQNNWFQNEVYHNGFDIFLYSIHAMLNNLGLV